MRFEGTCVLIVDDDPLVAMNHSDIVEDMGCQVVRAESVATGWNALKARPFDAIVLDHDLGDGKGWDILRMMERASISTPAIYLSATVASTLEVAAAIPEVRRVLSKPVSKENLSEALSELLKNAKGRDSHYPKLIADEERDMLLGAIAPEIQEGK
jgi:two-component system, OmpR family, response regulator QseB